MFTMKNRTNSRSVHSSQARRRVKLHNSKDDTLTVQNAKGKTYESGLDLSLFEGHVDANLICSLCSRVFVQPELSVCQHVFCSPCLHRNIHKECPTCREPLDWTPSQQPPVQLSLRLLDLVIHCDHKCGQILPLGQLPQHVSDDCPNSPVPCLHAKKGCKMKVKRCQLQEHVNECGWRSVECDACGEKTVYNQLHLHEKKNRCVENRIRNQLVQAIKSTSQEVRKHKKTIEHQRVQIESQQRRNELDHARRLQTLKTQQRQGTWVPHNTQMSLYKELSLPSSYNIHAKDSSRSSIDDTRHRQNTCLTPKLVPIHSSTPTPNNITSPRRQISQHQQATERKPSTAVVTTASTSGSNCNTTNVFVTIIDSEQEDDSKVNENTSIPASIGVQDDPFICKKCCKRVRGGNKPNSCRWHAGPIIELFGGTCYACGRLDYQNGCVIGYHEM